MNNKWPQLVCSMDYSNHIHNIRTYRSAIEQVLVGQQLPGSMMHDDRGEVVQVVPEPRAARVGHVAEHEARHVQRAQRERYARVHLSPGT